MNFDTRNVSLVLVVVVVVLLGYMMLNRPDNRDLGTRIGDAAEELQDRTPAEKIKDTVQDATDGKR